MQNDNILEVKNLKKYFPIKAGLLKKTVGNIKAVDNVSFNVKQGETVGLVGESGCGKTTLGRTIIRLHEPTDGEVNFKFNNKVVDLAKIPKNGLKPIRPKMQYIFQDPYAALNSRMTIGDIIIEPLAINKIGSRYSQIEKAKELLVKVGLKKEMLNRYPHEFSGGQ